ncbi:MAG: RNA 2',3'-cyclic phosphodiesterase [Chloroflexi bacterium]|nr:RNA 2',3'-cyclic phosphodiesterase [Chloroflexota bacterium]
MAEMLRLFIAVELSAEVKAALGQLIGAMRHRVEGVRWVDPDGIHLTMKFLGDVPSEQAAAIAAAMQQAAQGIAPFRLALQGVGGFPNLQRPRVLWVGLEGDVQTAKALHKALEGALEPLHFSREGRAFNPHLTLGRVREATPPAQRARIGEVLARVPSPPASPMPVEALSLIQSTLTPQGACYTRLHLTALGGGGA